MNKPSIRVWLYLVLLVVSSQLVACGGGDGSDSSSTSENDSSPTDEGSSTNDDSSTEPQTVILTLSLSSNSLTSGNSAVITISSAYSSSSDTIIMATELTGLLTFSDTNTCTIGSGSNRCTIAVLASTIDDNTSQTGSISFSSDDSDAIFSKTSISFTVNGAASSRSDDPSSSDATATVKGWPSYLAMGSITDDTLIEDYTDDTVSSEKSFQSRPVNAIFKYAGSGLEGDIDLDYPYYTKKTIVEANNLTTSYAASGAIPDDHAVLPVMVVYMANMSYDDYSDDFSETGIKNKFIKLIMMAKMLEANQDSNGDSVGSVVLNPDLLGYIQQNNLKESLDTTLGAMDLTSILTSAINFSEQETTYSYTGLADSDHRSTCEGSFTGNVNELYDDLYSVCSWGYWNAKEDWASLVDANGVVTDPSPVTNYTLPIITNDLKGWIVMTNWVMKTFAPDVSFGWQENLWASGGTEWLRDGTESSKATSVVDFLDELAVFDGDDQPDFIAFDRYEFDDFNSSAYSIGYLFNAQDWTTFFSYVGEISRQLDNKPVMLWQMPGGHIQEDGDGDDRGAYGGTFPNFMFSADHGGTSAVDFDNVNSYISEIDLATYSSYTQAIIPYLQVTPDGTGSDYTWNEGYLGSAVTDANVFSILFGGGNTTGVAAIPIVSVGDDGGWLSDKVINYFTDPIYFE
ncbi:hypothetical protein [uncultured Shewanella sp.]|uniref:hypothetical protein n=1 Tax=uncultured Shewanella sp. TaxID=173975 RepID=UPI00260C2AA0|nr:hypothetical protein [uncultured Shewanella sp.]